MSILKAVGESATHLQSPCQSCLKATLATPPTCNPHVDPESSRGVRANGQDRSQRLCASRDVACRHHPLSQLAPEPDVLAAGRRPHNICDFAQIVCCVWPGGVDQMAKLEVHLRHTCKQSRARDNCHLADVIDVNDVTVLQLSSNTSYSTPLVFRRYPLSCCELAACSVSR